MMIMIKVHKHKTLYDQWWSWGGKGKDDYQRDNAKGTKSPIGLSAKTYTTVRIMVMMFHENETFCDDQEPGYKR